MSTDLTERSFIAANRQLMQRSFAATNSHQLSIVILPIIMVAIATAFVYLRFRARKLLKMSPKADDYFSLAALILTWAFQFVNMAAVFKGGAGLPVGVVLASSPNALVTYLKLIVANFSLWVITVSIVQISILFLYLRVFGVSRVFTWITYVFLFLVTGFGIAGFVSEILTCSPVSKNWNPEEAGTCYNTREACMSIGLIHVFFDFGIVCLPMPWIWGLQMRRNNKIVVTCLLSIGVIASILSLLKTNCLSGLNLAGKPASDITDYLWLVILFQTLELPLGIICSCVPTLAPVWLEMGPYLTTLGSRLLSYVPASIRSIRSAGSGSRSVNNSGSRKGSDPTGNTTPFKRLEDESATAINKSSFSTTQDHATEDIPMHDL